MRENGRFGVHGGQYIPETLMNAVIELEDANTGRPIGQLVPESEICQPL